MNNGHKKRASILIIAFVFAFLYCSSADAAEKTRTGAANSAAKETTDKTEVFPQLGHSNIVTSVAFSPDGKFALSGSSELKLWEVASGREIRTFKSGASSIAFSPDGKVAMSVDGDEPLKIWDVGSGKEIRTVTFMGEAVEGSDHIKAFSPDGRLVLSVSVSGQLKLRDVESGREIRTLNKDSDCLNTVGAFSPDGRFVLSGSSDNSVVKLWEVTSGKEIRTLKGHSDAVISVAFSPDGKYALSGSNDKTVMLWEVASGKKIQTLNGHSDGVISVAFSPDGKYALSGSSDKTVKLWELASGKEIRTFKGLSKSVESVAFSPDGRLALSDIGKLWDIVNAKNIRTLKLQSGQQIGPHVAFSPDSRFALSGSWDSTVKLWDVESGNEMRTFTGHSSYINSVAFSPDGRFALSSSNDNMTNLWDVKSGRKIRTFTGHSDVVTSVAFSPDGRFALTGSFAELKLWEVASGREIRTFTELSHFVDSVAFSPDGRFALSGCTRDKTPMLWEVSTGKEIRTFTERSNGDTYQGYLPIGVKSVAFSPDGKYALSGSLDSTVKLWDVESGNEIRTFTGHSTSVNSIGFSPDGKYVLSGSLDGTIRRWDTFTGEEIAQYIAFEDGEWVVITSEGYYNSSANGDKHLNVRIGNKVYGIDQYRETFYRPDLVKIALQGGSLKDYRSIATVKQPPAVSFVDTPTQTAKDEITVKVKMVDIGGGIGDVRLYLNGTAIVLDNSRGLQIVSKQDDNAVYKTYNVRLISGINTIRAIAFNGDNTMQSTDVQHEVNASFKTITKPTLHALIIGINEFRNPKLNLNYPVADADLLEKTIKDAGSRLFEKVKTTKLTTKEETTNERIIKELKAYQSLNPDDLFLLFVASHGTVDDGEYFLITSNVGSTRTEKLKTDAISQSIMKELIANIPTTKKLIILDTCNAGAMGEALQMAMLTRGMNEDTAMKILSRAVGSTILSAATSMQEAVEGYKGHGLFTYVLTEGLSGKADKGKTGYVKTTDLADYVDNEVPSLAEKVFKKAQYPTISISGQAFPIGKVK